MSEAELHVLKARLRVGILNKVRRGEYRCPLPTGLVYDEAGNVALDPDMQIRDTIAHLFETFSRVGSACQTVKAFRREGLGLPSRLRGSATVFRPLTASTAVRVLSNPRLAGAYVYGLRLVTSWLQIDSRSNSRAVNSHRGCQLILTTMLSPLASFSVIRTI